MSTGHSLISTHSADLYVPAELPLSSYAAPPKMNDYLPKSAAAYSYSPNSAAGATHPAPYHPPGTLPMVGTPYHGPSAKPRAPLSPQIVDNHSPQPYHQAQPSWVAKPQPAYQQQPQQSQQSSYKQDSQQQQQQYQQSSTTTTTQKSMYEQARTSSGINTVKDMRSRFSGDNISGQSQTLPRNFLSAPQQQQQPAQQPAWNGSSPTAAFEGASKVRNASPLPFGRHATTTNKSQFGDSYTKTQFHNKLYQPPKGPLQHSFINNRSASSSAQQTNRQYRGSAHYDTYPQYDQPQAQQQQPQQYQQQQGQQQQHTQSYNEHVSRSHFRTPAQHQQHNTAPVFRNVTNFCFCR